MSSQIHDLGYRSYEGERLGVGWAVRSLAVHSMRRALGLKRAAKHKVVPVITIALAFLPAIAMVGMSVLVPDLRVSDLIGYGEYYGLIFWALFLFAAAAAPGILTTDRTTGMLAMYLATPLNRTTYVLAKVIGLFSVMLLVTVGPIIFLVLAYTFIGAGPGGVFDFVEILGRALFAGSLSAAFYTGVGLFVSSIPKRWGIASVCIVGALLVPVAVVAILFETDVPEWVSLFAPAIVMGDAWQHIFGESVRGTATESVAGSIVVLTALGYAAIGLALTWYRYQSIEVDR